MKEQDYLIYEDFEGAVHIIPLENLVRKVYGIYDERHLKEIEQALNIINTKTN